MRLLDQPNDLTEGVNGMVTVERSVLRIDRPEVQQGMTPQHRVRPLMPAAMRGISQPWTRSWR